MSHRDSVELTDGPLSLDEFDELWRLFVAIHETWGEAQSRIEDMASGFREFVGVKSQNPHSYLDEYRSACVTLKQLREIHGETFYAYVLLDPAVIADVHANTGSPVSRLRTFVVEEFIRVYVASGGFRSYGGKNYGGFVSGSRYRQNPPYRVSEGA